MEEKTGSQFGLNCEEQIKIALRVIINNGGKAEMKQIYEGVESKMQGTILSRQGRDTLRSYVNRDAVKKGYIHPYDEKNPGWVITNEGKNYINSLDGEISKDEDNLIEVVFPEEIKTPNVFYEGAVKKVYVNKYERNVNARRECIEHYGFDCYICSFNFGKVYGAIGEGFIHVHHLKPLSKIGEEYSVNPIEDLRPICPNCHAMVHRKDSDSEIKKIEDFWI